MAGAWVMDIIADLVEDAELATLLTEISEETLGCLPSMISRTNRKQKSGAV